MRKRLMRYVFATCCLLAGSAQCQAGVGSIPWIADRDKLHVELIRTRTKAHDSGLALGRSGKQTASGKQITHKSLSHLITL